MSFISPKRVLEINSLGDSLSNLSTYQPYGAGLTSTYALMGAGASPVVPDWTVGMDVVTYRLCKNAGRIYLGIGTGTTTVGNAPTGSGNTDGSITWTVQDPIINREGFLAWAEVFSGGRLRWKQETGYSGTAGGAVKVIVTNPGANYTAPVFVCSSGMKCHAVLDGNGGIASIVIDNPGGNSPTITSHSDATGSGATFSIVNTPGGTFAVPGCQTKDMVARLADVIASIADIITVCGGTNDISSNIALSVICANLRTCWETIMRSGKAVVAITIPARSAAVSQTIDTKILAVNRFIIAYCRGERWANPLGFSNIALADVNGFFADGTSTGNGVIGGTAGTAEGSETIDGLHWIGRGHHHVGWVVNEACSPWLNGSPALYSARSYTRADGYDSVDNPGGNFLEGRPWQASRNAVVGDLCCNDSPAKVYYCITPGQTAASGGPTGTGSNITDGAAHWAYAGFASGMSVMASAATALASPPSGITFSGNIPASFTLNRRSGNAQGTIKGLIENPWCDGTVGQRLSLHFALGLGGAGELWSLDFPFVLLTNLGFLPADLGVAQIESMVEVELSGCNLMNCLYLYSKTDLMQYTHSTGNQQQTTGSTFWPSGNRKLDWPNKGKMLLRTTPYTVPANASSLSLGLYMGFNASGAADSATGVVKINFLGCRRAGV